MQKVKDIRDKFVKLYQNQEFVIDKTGVKVIDIIGKQFEADEPYIFGMPNYDYIQREIEWYKSKSLNVYDIPGGPPKIWERVSDENGFINSNYGWMVFSKENGSQYQNCLNELRKNKDSRRGVMIYMRPEMWNDYDKNGMSDFCCTWGVQFLIRNDILYSYIIMRSNDCVFGFKNDRAWHQYVLDKLSKDLNIKNTKMIWNAGSLHIYERHFYLLEHYIKTGETHITKKEYDKLYIK